MGGMTWAFEAEMERERERQRRMKSQSKKPSPIASATSLLESSEIVGKLWKDLGPNKDESRAWDTCAALLHKWLEARDIVIDRENVRLVPNPKKDGFKVLLGEGVNLLVLDELDEDVPPLLGECTCMTKRGIGHG